MKDLTIFLELHIKYSNSHLALLIRMHFSYVTFTMEDSVFAILIILLEPRKSFYVLQYDFDELMR